MGPSPGSFTISHLWASVYSGARWVVPSLGYTLVSAGELGESVDTEAPPSEILIY